ncbi:hypothetical protein F5Y19DRAFT_477504 [Xylariaceae sp. FL1651]|nr:hypothetical protein F5Y19DRAFT_477504 [Xylariaceae sp. FL1651]
MKSVVFGGLAQAATVSALSGTATTTRYYDRQEGACGCASSSGAYSWALGGQGFYTAAASQALFGAAGSTWCDQDVGPVINSP